MEKSVSVGSEKDGHRARVQSIAVSGNNVHVFAVKERNANDEFDRLVRKWEDLERKRRRVEEEDESESKRLRVTEAEPIAFSSVMLNLHETMKHLTVIANIVKTVEAQRLSADYIGGGGGGVMEQIDMDGYDGDDRAKEMIKCFRARSKTMKNVSEKIRETVKKLRTCIQQNRTYERELVNLQKMWQIVPSKIQENEVVTSDTSLSVLTGFGENCNHALSSSKDCQEAMRVHLERLENNDKDTHKFGVSSALDRVPMNLRLSIVSRKQNRIMSEACLIDHSSSDFLLESIHQRVQCFEIFTLARSEALISNRGCCDLSNPVVVRVPILSRVDDVFDLVLELMYNSNDEVDKKKKKNKDIPSWTASAALDHIQALVLNWRTTRKFSERPLGSGKHASPDAPDPAIHILQSAASYVRNILVLI